MAQDIKLSLVNQALTAIGEDPVTDLTGSNACTRAAIQNYDDIVAAELENARPKFAMRTKQTPTLLTAESEAPIRYRWQIPGEAMTVVSVLRSGFPLDSELFEREEDFIRCAFNSGISLKYIIRAPEEKWSGAFRRIIVGRLKALFLDVTERASAAAITEQATDTKGIVFRHTDASQRRNRPVGDGSIVQARQGLRRRRG